MHTFKNNIINIYGQKGKTWLDLLPDRIQQIKDQYHLTKPQPIENLSFNYILKGFQNGQAIILKIAIDEKSLENEADALEAFQGFYTPKIYAKEKDFLILTQAIPGDTLKNHFPNKEIDSIEIFCGVLNALHQVKLPNNHSFQSIEKWLVALDKDYDIPLKYLSKARILYKELLKTQAKEILLHGDLHHDNIIKHQNDWMMIDPKGIIGEPAFDVCAFIRNPIPDLLEQNNPKAIIDQRIVHCARLLNLSEDRINKWFFVEAVLGWLWDLEDNLDPSYFKNLLEIID
ncbi:phosphotransferase [Thiotrichales bacterium 19X7-9]|nr:phosphotransferase [Thiotrichales bacterium 19X7-9]